MVGTGLEHGACVGHCMVVDSVCIDVFNQSAEALRRIKAEINRFERYLEQKIKSYAKLELESEKPSSSIDKLIGSMSPVAIRELFREKFMLLDPSLKHGIIAVMLQNVLAKHDQQVHSQHPSLQQSR